MLTVFLDLIDAILWYTVYGTILLIGGTADLLAYPDQRPAGLLCLLAASRSQRRPFSRRAVVVDVVVLNTGFHASFQTEAYVASFSLPF